jgi:hypothetical protein
MSYELADGSLSTDYEIGDTFVYNDPKGEDNGTFRNGSVIKFLRDDKSDCPLFSLVEGKCLDNSNELRGTETSYAMWKKLTKYSETPVVKEQDPEVIIKQPDAFVRITQDEYDSLIDEINMLRELVAELTVVKEEQTFKPISEMTLEDWRQAERERWVFQTEHRGLVTVCDVDSDLQDLIPIQLESGEGNTWYVGLDGGDIDQESWTVVKRVK